jgi:exopolysaccharide biosynthesis polyprenyl glycosylphosphotransferase
VATTDLSATEATRAPVAAPAHLLWPSTYGSVLVVLDALCITVAGAVALRARFGGADVVITDEGVLAGVPFSLVVAAAAPAWVLLLAVSRAYDVRYLGVGSEEYKSLLSGSFRFAAALGLASYALQASLSRHFFVVLVLLGTVLLLLARYAARKALHALRVRGRCLHRVVLIGTEEEVQQLDAQLLRGRYAGLAAVAACLPDYCTATSISVASGELPVIGAARDLAPRLREVRADSVAVAGTSALSARELRELSWQLEGSGVDLLVAPAITDVAGPRIHIRPVAGLPLLHVDEPIFGGPKRLAKALLDLSLALLLLVVLLVPSLLIGLAVALDSRGPILYRQERVGRGGTTFPMWKFRSMRVGADREVTELQRLNEADGPLFKLRDDPRITRVGRFLRRHSLDEIPQLINVLTGSMSLVGPRPPLQSEVARYPTRLQRKLLVKPGMTGLWQISGRTDLSWDEAVRLDLYYVENWSAALDALILWKTLAAVVRGRGAY